MKEGLIYKLKGKIYPYDELEDYLYAFNNRYGLLVRRALGGVQGTDTYGADKGLYVVRPCGIGLKASEIRDFEEISDPTELLEVLSYDEMEGFLKSPGIEKLKDKFDVKTSQFKAIKEEDIKAFIEVTKNQEEREATHVVESFILNPSYSIEEAAKKYKTKTYDVTEEEFFK